MCSPCDDYDGSSLSNGIDVIFFSLSKNSLSKLVLDCLDVVSTLLKRQGMIESLRQVYNDTNRLCYNFLIKETLAPYQGCLYVMVVSRSFHAPNPVVSLTSMYLIVCVWVMGCYLSSLVCFDHIYGEVYTFRRHPMRRLKKSVSCPIISVSVINVKIRLLLYGWPQ